MGIHPNIPFSESPSTCTVQWVKCHCCCWRQVPCLCRSTLCPSIRARTGVLLWTSPWASRSYCPTRKRAQLGAIPHSPRSCRVSFWLRQNDPDHFDVDLVHDTVRCRTIDVPPAIAGLFASQIGHFELDVPNDEFIATGMQRRVAYLRHYSVALFKPVQQHRFYRQHRD